MVDNCQITSSNSRLKHRITTETQRKILMTLSAWTMLKQNRLLLKGRYVRQKRPHNFVNNNNNRMLPTQNLQSMTWLTCNSSLEAICKVQIKMQHQQLSCKQERQHKRDKLKNNNKLNSKYNVNMQKRKIDRGKGSCKKQVCQIVNNSLLNSKLLRKQ